jgi:aminopeptidase N
MNTPKTIYLKDYTKPDYLIDSVDLFFDLHEELTTVTAQLKIKTNPEHKGEIQPLVLNGKDIILKSVTLNGVELEVANYEVTSELLIIKDVPEVAFQLEIKTQIKPINNTSLSGLYVSRGNFCTQCEAEGFRRITYFIDRPDVLARYSTTISADKKSYPVLLSNGNLVAKGDYENNRHWVKWEDPFKKPSYLFALVAGNLAVVEDVFVTKSQRPVKLQIYVEQGNENKCSHAMQSLKNAMRWDESVFGLEYDLDIYMIVAVSDFNMGAMENKGLNIFNSQYILALSDTATDMDYEAIESVIGHEYFHNWSGNRVTCRDWFQLSLKEGFTIFRDQEFTADQWSRAVCRINNVKGLRDRQFIEDAGPLSHPVRPASYMEINNFYTTTVYNKGAELIRMMQTLLGNEKFFKGVSLYFQRHDGQAVTTNDFVNALEDASGIDLTQFSLWYSQAGTPQLHIDWTTDEKNKSFTLHVKQYCPPTPGQPDKKPLHIPLTIALLDPLGHEYPLMLQGESSPGKSSSTRVLSIINSEQQFTFINIDKKPLPSLLRNFSAPVILKANYTDNDLIFLLKHDTDPFNRWEAGQQLATKMMLSLIKDYQNNGSVLKNHALINQFVSVFKEMLKNNEIERDLLAQLLILPDEVYLGEKQSPIDVVATHRVRKFVRQTLATQCHDEFLSVYQENMTPGPYSIDQKIVAKRTLRNVGLSYLMTTENQSIRALCMRQFTEATNMTDSISALKALSNSDCPERAEALAIFYEKWKDELLVVNKWLAIQAQSELNDTLSQVRSLMNHPSFDIKNPNKIRALIGNFCNNRIQFHAEGGEGYQFLADQVLTLDSLNPQLAARMFEPLTHWKRYDDKRQLLMKSQIERILKKSGLSRDVFEMATKTMAEADKKILVASRE